MQIDIFKLFVLFPPHLLTLVSCRRGRPEQEIAISLSEVLDSRRDANGAWELLGRSEALPEERLFAAAKQAKSEGGGKANKERTKDLIDAYK